MKHPRMTRNPRLCATVPTLSGGLDLATAPSRVGDTVLTDGCDMVYRDGLLRTRKGFVTDSTRFSALALGTSERFFVDPQGYLLVLAQNDTEANGEVSIAVFDPDGVCTDTLFTLTGPFGLNGFFVATSEAVLSDRYTALLILNNGEFYGVNAAEGRCDWLNNKAYVPTYAINGTPAKTRTEQAVIGDRAEPFNRLTRTFRCTYSTDGEGMYYALPRVWSYGEITVAVTRPNETLHFTLTSGSNTSNTVSGYTVCCDRMGGCLWFVKNNEPCALPSDGVHNNVTVTAEHDVTESTSLTQMNCGVWLADGRLFLAGGNHVMWSAVGNPLYFPVTAYTQLGNPDQAVTALHMQGEQLVVFKERSLYAVTPQQNTAVTADDVMKGETVDVTATALFAVEPLHATIGCDLPYTVQLFGNRLTWGCTDGAVYTLGTGGSLSQRMVTVISDAVHPLLRTAVPANAVATVCDGRYWLLWDDKMLVAEDEREPRWMRFSFDNTRTEPLWIGTVRGEIVIACAYAVGTSKTMWYYRQHGETDTAIRHTGTGWHDATYTLTAVPVRGVCCTKHFDFGDPETYKRVTKVFADVTATGAVEAAYVTERGPAKELPQIPRDGLRLTPHLTRCRRVAVRLCGEGLQVGSLTLHVITGGR